ncbi:MAG: hypothetical protein QXD49_08250 [Archaeoglobaceae archaeon]
MKFSEWKAVTLARLLELRDKYAENAKVVGVIDNLIKKVHAAKTRDLSSLIFLFYEHRNEVPELTGLLPPREVLEQFFKDKK